MQTCTTSSFSLARSSFSAVIFAKIERREGSSPQSAITTGMLVRPLLDPAASIFFTTFMPSSTFPKTTAPPKTTQLTRLELRTSLHHWHSDIRTALVLNSSLYNTTDYAVGHKSISLPKPYPLPNSHPNPAPQRRVKSSFHRLQGAGIPSPPCKSKRCHSMNDSKACNISTL